MKSLGILVCCLDKKSNLKNSLWLWDIVMSNPLLSNCVARSKSGMQSSSSGAQKNPENMYYQNTAEF